MGQWCGEPLRRWKLTSTSRHMLVVVTSDDHDNLYEGFTLQYYAVPGWML